MYILFIFDDNIFGDNMSKIKQTKKSVKPAVKIKMNKAEEMKSNNTFKKFLGHSTGLLCTVIFFTGIYFYLFYLGVFPSPVYLNSFPEEFISQTEISPIALDSVEVKKLAWDMSNENNMKTTLNLNEEELYALMAKEEKNIEIISIDNMGLIIGQKKTAGKGEYKVLCRVDLVSNGGRIHYSVKELYIGQYEVPQIIVNLLKKWAPVKFMENSLKLVSKKFNLDSGKIELKFDKGIMILKNNPA